MLLWSLGIDKRFTAKMQKFPAFSEICAIDTAGPRHVIIPFRQLSHDALLGLVEEFVTRDGTDYGENEIPLARKVAQVLKQLEEGELMIVFDADSNSCNIVTKENLSQLGYLTDDDNE